MSSGDAEDQAEANMRQLSRARAQAMKLRTAIMRVAANEAEYRREFNSISGGSGKHAELDGFAEYIEEMLNISVSDNDAQEILNLFDMDGDGKLSIDDFVSFIIGQNSDALKALQGGNPDLIVDIKISTNASQEAELTRNGYLQVNPENITSHGVTGGTFGKGESLWIWKRKQGTCSGRLRPIVDIQLSTFAVSSAMVLSGYVRVADPVGGHWLWLKRALSIEDEQDAILDLYVTMGRSKIPSDKIWTSPGVGWIRVDGNFAKPGIIEFARNDAFLWFLPCRTRTLDAVMLSPIRTAVALTEEVRRERVLACVRTAIRHFVPVTDMKRLAFTHTETTEGAAALAARSDGFTDFIALYHKFDTTGRSHMTKSKFSNLLNDIGACVEAIDLTWCFYCFNVKLDQYVTLQEFADAVSLTDHEVDLLLDRLRRKLLSSTLSNSSTTGTASAAVKNKLRENKLLGQIFHLINTSKSGILSLPELLGFTERLELFITENEGRKLLNSMDISGHNRVEEGDFITFMRRADNVLTKKAQRLRIAAAKTRTWLQQGQTGAGATASTTLAHQWQTIKKRRERSSGYRFPGYLVSEDLMLLNVTFGLRLSAMEARELMLIIAPERGGKISQGDLQLFMSRNCRMFGELDAVLERDVLKPLLDIYRAHREEVRKTGQENVDLAERYDAAIKELVRQVQGTHVASAHVIESNISSAASSPTPGANNPPAGVGSTAVARPGVVHDVVSIYQLKTGVEAAMRGYQATEGQLLNLEEWALYSCRVGAAVAEEERYGVKVKAFLENFCVFIAGSLSETHENEVPTFESLKRDIQRMIVDEAKAAGKGKNLDFAAVFRLFDEDGGGTISIEEFKRTLYRLKIVDHLPEAQIPALLTQFDKTKKGYITKDDFMAFVSANKNLIDDDDPDNDEDDLNDEDELPGFSSNTPPAAITKDADCDWLSWFLWKEACKLEPGDPESVVTELETTCAETEIIKRHGTITTKELWNILFEMKIRGIMTKQQFDKSVIFIVQDDSGRITSSNHVTESTQVDYEALCRYIIRMGRAFNAKVQEQRIADEKAFQAMFDYLKLEFEAMMKELPAVAPKPQRRTQHVSELPRFEKALRRLDADSDGMVTAKEFRSALRRLKVRDAKKWTIHMVKKLISLFDTKTPGLLVINEFVAFVRGEPTSRRNKGATSASAGGNTASDSAATKADNLSDDEGMEEIFSRQKALNDQALFRKIRAVLLESIQDANGENLDFSNASGDVVKVAIRKYFQKSDPEHKGLVNEERFRAFTRQTGLQDQLTAAELRRMFEKLRKKRSPSEKGAYLVDYERLCRLLPHNGESIPLSKAEGLMCRLQEAARSSAAAGRPFLALCSLVDRKSSGLVTKDELVTIAKMMGNTLSTNDFDVLHEILPEGVIGVDGRIDYNELNHALVHFVPRDLNSTMISDGGDPSRAASRGRSGALPSYATPGLSTHLSTSAFSRTGEDPVRQIQTPSGMYLSAPPSPSRFETSLGRLSTRRGLGGLGFGGTDQFGGGAGSYERLIAELSELIQIRLKEKSRVVGAPVSLLRMLEALDVDRTGLLSIRSLQGTLEDIGLTLTPTDLLAIETLYCSEGDRIYYESFCADIGDNGSPHEFNASLRASSRGRPTGGLMTTTDVLPRGNDDRLLQRFRELRASGINLREGFAYFDVDNTGLLDTRKFREVAQRLQLFQTEYQLVRIMEEFASLGDRSLIAYEEFCAAVENLERRHERDRLGVVAQRPLASSSLGASRGFVDGSGFDGLAGRLGVPGGIVSSADDIQRLREDERWLDSSTEVSPRGGFGFNGNNRDVYSSQSAANENLSRFRMALAAQTDLDDSVDTDTGGSGLFGPKVSASVSLPRRSNSARLTGGSGGGRPPTGNNLFRSNAADPFGSPKRSHSSSVGIWSSAGLAPESPYSSLTAAGGHRLGGASTPVTAPRSSPSKVGSVIWGHDTPLAQKGQTPYVDDATWCCAVCLYCENPVSVNKCAVCECPNYSSIKEYQIKEQCQSCTFMNGQFARECEMCGKPLSHGKTTSAQKEQTTRYR